MLVSDIVWGDNFSFAEQADYDDCLSAYRDKFMHAEKDLIYMDGNSLGRLPLQTRDKVSQLVDEQWGKALIRSWNSDWIDLNRRIGAKIARLIGAKPNEVLLTDSTSINLFKLAFASMKMQCADKNRIVSDELNFPSDLYVLQGLVDLFESQYELVLAKSHNGISVTEDEIRAAISTQTALLCLSHVSFKTAFKYEMSSITRLAHDSGAQVLWDLSHSVGAVPIKLNDCEVDLAVGCTYKYLNGGPGASAFLYVGEDLQDQLQNPIWAWFAHENPFDFSAEFEPASGINRFLTSTTPVLSAAATEYGIDLLLEAGMDNLRQKSIRQTEYLLYLFNKWLKPNDFILGSPKNPQSRGSHISICHPEAYRITQALIHPAGDQKIIIPDFRSPNYIRLGVTPLYTSYKDIYQSMHRIREIVEAKEYERQSGVKDVVT